MGKRLREEEWIEVKRLYVEEGLSCQKLGPQFGVSSTTVAKHLKAMGVIFREGGWQKGQYQGERKRRYTLNHNAFDNIGTDSMAAYFFGLLLTDGCLPNITKNPLNNVITFAQSSPREDLMYKFMAFIGCDKPVSRPKKQDWESDKFTVEIRSVRMRQALMAYGMMPRKTSNQTVDARLVGNRDFWRGVFDGDGYLTLDNRKGLVVKFGSTSPDLASKWATFCNQVSGKRGVRLYKSQTPKGTPLWRQLNGGEVGFKIAESLYEGAEVFCDSKYAVYVRAKDFFKK